MFKLVSRSGDLTLLRHAPRHDACTSRCIRGFRGSTSTARTRPMASPRASSGFAVNSKDIHTTATVIDTRDGCSAKYHLDQCDSQTAALFEFERDSMKSLPNSRGIVAEDNPCHPCVGIHMPQQDAQRLAQSISWLQHLDESPPEPPIEDPIPEPPPAPLPGLPGPLPRPLPRTDALSGPFLGNRVGQSRGICTNHRELRAIPQRYEGTFTSAG